MIRFPRVREPEDAMAAQEDTKGTRLAALAVLVALCLHGAVVLGFGHDHGPGSVDHQCVLCHLQHETLLQPAPAPGEHPGLAPAERPSDAPAPPIVEPWLSYGSTRGPPAR